MERYLIDTNIFLEIFLNQERVEKCKSFLSSNIDKIFISDFSLHSIGVMLFRFGKCEVFKSFMNDIEGKIKIASLDNRNYSKLCELNTQYKLDFDDAYQVSLAQQENMIIVTMDKDFFKKK